MEELREVLEAVEDPGKKAFTIRFAVGVGPDQKLNLKPSYRK